MSLDRARKTKNGKHRRCAKSPKTSVYITKTLSDPADTLSKINASSLLIDAEENSPETIVVRRNDIPLDGTAGGSVTNITLMEDGAIKKLSSGGRRKPLKYFNNQIRELKQIDKKAVEPARIVLNLTTDSSSMQPSKKKSRRMHKRNRNTVKVEDSDYEQIQCWWNNCKERPDYKFDEESRTITLGDYLPMNCENQLIPGHSKSSCVIYSHSDIPEETKATSSKFIGLQNITDATKAEHIFEIIDLDMESPYDLEQTVSKVPEQYTIRWCGSDRVSVSTLPLSQPQCVVFFEKTRRTNILRFRVSINWPYLLIYDKNYIIDSVTRAAKKDISTIYEQIIDYLKELKKNDKDIRNDDSRAIWFPECFMSAVNSRWIAPNAVGFSEQDQLKYLIRFYSECCSSQSNSFQAPEDPPKCCCCRMPNSDDVFPSSEGMMCKDCVVSSIIRQL